MERDRWQHGREWDLDKRESACTACGSGCRVVVNKKDGKIVKEFDDAISASRYAYMMRRFARVAQNKRKPDMSKVFRR